MDKLKVAIIAKDKVAYEGEAESIFVPTQTGIIEILPEHMQLVSALASGDVIIKTKDGVINTFKISGGVLEIRSKSNIIILADIIS